MKTIQNIIEKSALGVASLFFRYLAVTVFLGVVCMVMALCIKVLTDPAYVSARFNF